MAEPGALDPLLVAYLAAPDDAAADARLGELIGGAAAPVVDHVVRAQLAGVATADCEDVAAGVLLRLTETLRGLREGRRAAAIDSLEAYAVATARNACRAFLRARQPERTRLANQVRYLLGHDPALAVWAGRDGRLLAGLSGWRERDRAAPPAAGDLPFDRPPERMALRELVRRLLLHRGGPWPVPELVGALAALRGVHDAPPVALSADPGEEEGSGFELVEGRPGQDREVEDRQFLALLWGEVRELPRRQRVAILLNLRDPAGGDMLSLFPATGLARPRELARVLEIALEELEELWSRLPLEDREIAEMLEATPRQVINLRKSARERLARRMLKQAETDPSGGR